MLERAWWATYVKPKWHQPLKEWLAWKVQDAVFKGMPDVICNAKGKVAMVELKYIHHGPARPDTRIFSEAAVKQGDGKGLSVEQRNHLEQWASAGGTACGFFGLGKVGYLLSFETINPYGMTAETLEQSAILVCNGYQTFGDVMKFFEQRRKPS